MRITHARTTPGTAVKITETGTDVVGLYTYGPFDESAVVYAGDTCSAPIERCAECGGAFNPDAGDAVVLSGATPDGWETETVWMCYGCQDTQAAETAAAVLGL